MLSAPAPQSPTTALLTALDDELHDARRVLSQGQEEDLRCALERALNKVEELSSLLRTALRTQTELETQLNLAKSNLQLVICNNEMLEEALKRETPCNAKDVGWRRWSAREVQNYNTERKSDERQRSLDYGTLNESGTRTVPSSPPAIHENGVKQPVSASAVGQESRFFRFRFSSGGSDIDAPQLPLKRPTRTGARSPVSPAHLAHLTSPSLSSLVPNAREKEIEELQEQLERERQAHKAAEAAKVALEAELESLSQALFEEANKMVATERMKRVDTEEELGQTRLEKEALLQALRLIEVENGQLRGVNDTPDTPVYRSVLSETPSRSSLPLQSSPKPPSPQTSEVTRPITPLHETPSRPAKNGLEVEPGLALPTGLLWKTASMEKLDVDLSRKESELPVIGNSPPVPLLPDEPSPWANGAS